jgi:hypothetical protein
VIRALARALLHFERRRLERRTEMVFDLSISRRLDAVILAIEAIGD